VHSLDLVKSKNYIKITTPAMKTQAEAITKILQTIDWRKIKSYHKKLNILWEYPEEGIERLPTTAELRGELRSIIEHMMHEDLSYISHGCWIVFWDREDAAVGDLRVIFRLVDFLFEENRDSRESMEEALKRAVEREDYEQAAHLRDAILEKKKKERVDGN